MTIFFLFLAQLEAFGAEVVNAEKGVTYQELHERAECWLVEASSQVPMPLYSYTSLQLYLSIHLYNYIDMCLIVRRLACGG